MPVIRGNELGSVGVGCYTHCQAIRECRNRFAVNGFDRGLAFALGDLQNQITVTLFEVQYADNRFDTVDFFERWCFQHVSAADFVVKENTVAMQAEPLPLAPFARERAIRFFVEAAQAGIFKTIRARLGPARCDRVGEETFADKLRMSAVAAVVNNASPVDELVAAPRRRHPQCVGLEHHKLAALGHAARTLVEADRDALIGDVTRGHLDRGAQVRAVIHVDVWLAGQLDVVRSDKRGNGESGRYDTARWDAKKMNHGQKNRQTPPRGQAQTWSQSFAKTHCTRFGESASAIVEDSRGSGRLWRWSRVA